MRSIKEENKIIKVIRISLFIILFTVLSLLAIVFLKIQYETNNESYELTISLNEAVGLSNTEIVEQLLTQYFEHYKDKPLFNNQRIKEYKITHVSEVSYVADGRAFTIEYLIQQHFWNDYWEIGGSRHEKNGMLEKLRYVRLNKEKDQFRLQVMGLEPPDRKWQK